MQLEVGPACFFRPGPSEPRAFKFLLQAFESQNFLYLSLLQAYQLKFDHNIRIRLSLNLD